MTVTIGASSLLPASIYARFEHIWVQKRPAIAGTYSHFEQIYNPSGIVLLVPFINRPMRLLDSSAAQNDFRLLNFPDRFRTREGSPRRNEK
jgi:hypothetical protein